MIRIQDIKIGTRVTTGFSMLILLIVVVSGTAYMNGQSFGGAIAEYAHVSGNSSRVATLGESVTNLERHVQLFALTGDESTGKHAKDELQNLRTQTQTLIDATQNVERRGRIEQASRILAAFSTEFDKQVKAEADRAAEQHSVEALGLRMRLILTQIMDRLIAERIFELATSAGVTQEALMLARMEALRFLKEPTQELTATLKSRMASYVVKTGKLAQALPTGYLRRMAEGLLRDAEVYQTTFDRIGALSMAVRS